ncbi:Ger(x)C family spore germination protein [Paenibacillus flagellatus]|uniref:Ger(X)C family spore germination protein n=1 Tax=Paenibacillus flagellatus TaxID=2211139 RepID=A0A2V5KM18_9BACL|nr:Ger(x)C family spore germination protein [Paenibacillus flagellatus]PYI51927.1 hypothetical protein DLM86_23760 [Paenibacillus flagellatus]
MRKHVVVLVMAVVPLLLSTGCWNRIELNDRAFVTAIYLDSGENGDYELSLGFPLPNRLGKGTQSGGGGEGNPYTIVTKSGKTIPMAYQSIRSDMSREIAWGHTRVLVIGWETAKRGVGPVLEFLARLPAFHTKTYVLVARGKARDTSGLTPVFERFPAEVLREYSQRRVALRATLKDFYEAQSFGGATVASMLTIGEKKMLSEKGQASPWAGTDGAVLFSDSRVAGTLDKQETRGAMWIKGEMERAVISIPSPTDGKPMSFSVVSAQTKTKPLLRDESISFRIRIEADAYLVSSESAIDVTSPAEMAKLEKTLADQVAGRIRSALDKTQKLGVDSFQFAQRLEWRYPKTWTAVRDRWPDLYRNMKFDVKASIRVKHPGGEINSMIRQNGARGEGEG